jgi:hypothetical protein
MFAFRPGRPPAGRAVHRTRPRRPPVRASAARRGGRPSRSISATCARRRPDPRPGLLGGRGSHPCSVLGRRPCARERGQPSSSAWAARPGRTRRGTGRQDAHDFGPGARRIPLGSSPSRCVTRRLRVPARPAAHRPAGAQRGPSSAGGASSSCRLAGAFPPARAVPVGRVPQQRRARVRRRRPPRQPRRRILQLQQQRGIVAPSASRPALQSRPACPLHGCVAVVPTRTSTPRRTGVCPATRTARSPSYGGPRGMCAAARGAERAGQLPQHLLAQHRGSGQRPR